MRAAERNDAGGDELCSVWPTQAPSTETQGEDGSPGCLPGPALWLCVRTGELSPLKPQNSEAAWGTALGPGGAQAVGVWVWRLPKYAT